MTMNAENKFLYSGRPLRVLILTYVYTDYHPRYGGEGRVVWETTQALARAGVRVFVVSSIVDYKSPPHPSITVYRVPFAGKNFLNFNAGEMLKIFFFSIPLIFLKRIDVIHHLPTHGPDPFARCKFGRPFVESADQEWKYENERYRDDLAYDRKHKLEEAGYDAPSFGMRMWTAVALRFFRMIGTADRYPRGTDLFLCRSRPLVLVLEKSHPESMVRYVPNGVNPEMFRTGIAPLFPKLKDGVRFLYAGGIARRKGTHYLIQGFIVLLKQYPHSELLLVGRGIPAAEAEFKAIAASYPQIKFLGDVSNEDFRRAFASADVFCLPSLGGGMHLVLFEALASGLPVITTKDSTNGDVVLEHNAGIAVEYASAENLARAMEQFVRDPLLIKTLGERALAASKQYSWDEIAKTIIRNYCEVLERFHHNK